jgi:predicted secreted protein
MVPHPKPHHRYREHMTIRTVSALATAAAALICFSLTSCAAAPKTVTVDFTDHAAKLAVGDELVIDFGEVNASVGSAWVVIADPDPSVLTVPEQHTEYLGENGSVGAPNHLTYSLTAVGSGNTRVQFEYQFRGAVPEDPQEQRTAVIDVTVTPSP